MKNFGRWAFVFAVAIIAIACGTPHAADAQSISWLSILPAIVGATTGTKSSGSDFVGMSDIMKETYGESFENNVEKETEVLSIIKQAEGFEITDGPDGKQINLSHVFSSGGGVGSMLEDDYLYTPTTPTAKQSQITIKQHTATVELSGRTLRRVKKGPAAFISWASEALPRKAARLAFHRDRMSVGAGTGALFRINGTPDATDDGVDSAYGIAGLEGPLNLILRDDNTRWGPNLDGTSLRTGTAKFVSGSYDNNTATFSALPTSGADNDYVFLGDTNVNSGGARESMGLEGLIDDGTVLATLQGLSRTTYPELKSQVIDSSLNGWTQELNEEILDYADSLCYERGNMGRPNVILVNRSGQRSFWKSLKGDRVLNDPKGTFQGGKARLKMMLGDRIVTIQAARKVPSSRCYGLDTRTIKRFRIGRGRWDDTDGSVWNRSVDGTGRKDAFFAVYIEEEEMGIGDPAQSFKITNLAAA
jgi:hypothetical protein